MKLGYNYVKDFKNEGRSNCNAVRYIEFNGIYDDSFPLMVVDGTELTGPGSNVTVERFRKNSKNLLFEPVPNDMLFMSSDTPQIVMTVGNNDIGTVMSVCNLDYTDSDECQY